MRIVPYVLATFMVFSAVSVSAQTIGTSTIDAGAPGPILGAGLPLLGAGGIGYGVYWLVNRRPGRSEA